uniref:Sodium-coupled neutral amino acid transporter 10 n=1 Tax=Dermatophagoides pteronyssinus TaxID=6956 RepID=A0A6P6YGR7_DERPT|nr:putative sodium-coupled neutral amino acid transporter 10 [Dermatophagoides pteronyssinus]
MVKMNRSLTNIINLSNSIIGVSILAMPLCFKQCGIILALFIISFSALLNYFSCYLLLKSSIINRRRNFELLAYDVFGTGGKTLVEICLLLFLLGTCVAFFVIVGDIAPSLISHIFELEQGPQLRALCMTFLAMFIILPLGLLRDVNNLTSFSMMSLIVYLFLALRMLYLSMDKFILIQPNISILNQLNYWNSSFIITYLPIFSMALSCQPQLFEIFNVDLFQTTKTGSSLRSIMRSIKKALWICSIVYIMIGYTGYIAFYNLNFSGNILQNLPSGLTTKLTLLSFLITILTSFPLCLFPSRTSLHSLLFRKGVHYDLLSTSHSSIHMSDYHFKLLTILLIITTMGISIIFPRVELILALVGSTIGSTICFIIPALIFIKICDKNTIEYLFSYLLLFFGTAILIFCTMSAIHNISMARDTEIEEKINEFKQQKFNIPNNKHSQNGDNDDEKSIKQSPMDMKSRINNINKLKKSIENDMNRLKKQQDIYKRLEHQQQQQQQSNVIGKKSKNITNTFDRKIIIDHQSADKKIINDKIRINQSTIISKSLLGVNSSSIINNGTKSNKSSLSSSSSSAISTIQPPYTIDTSLLSSKKPSKFLTNYGNYSINNKTNHSKINNNHHNHNDTRSSLQNQKFKMMTNNSNNNNNNNKSPIKSILNDTLHSS